VINSQTFVLFKWILFLFVAAVVVIIIGGGGWFGWLVFTDVSGG